MLPFGTLSFSRKRLLTGTKHGRGDTTITDLNNSNKKLGRKATKNDPRTFKLAKYLSPNVIPDVPDKADWGHGTTNWGMMLNNDYGDCTAAGIGHIVRLWNDRTSKPVIISDDDVIKLYEAVTDAEGAPFNPATGENDNGCAELDVLKYVRKNGFSGHSVDAFASVDPKNELLLKATIWLFGAAYVGVSLPLAAQTQGSTWYVSGPLIGRKEPGSWGGHAVILTAYDDVGLTAITWGQEQKLTWNWWKAYGDEAYALLSGDWIDSKSNLSPSNFDINALKTDLAAL